jgi:hypothetical protein
LPLVSFRFLEPRWRLWTMICLVCRSSVRTAD